MSDTRRGPKGKDQSAQTPLRGVPEPPSHLDAVASVARFSRIPIAGGETLFDYRDYRAAFERAGALFGAEGARWANDVHALMRPELARLPPPRLRPTAEQKRERPPHAKDPPQLENEFLISRTPPNLNPKCFALKFQKCECRAHTASGRSSHRPECTPRSAEPLQSLPRCRASSVWPVPAS